MRVGILARKSTDKQASSIDRQVADARLFAARNGWTVIEPCIFFVPEGISGALLDRPELRALVDAGKKRLIDAVVLQTSDRLTRLMIETVSIVVDLLDAGIRAFSYTTGEEYKADSSTDRFMLAVKGFVAETERENIVARTSQAAFYRARLGCVAGNRLYGYDNVPMDIGGKDFKVRRPNEDESRWVAWIHQHYDQAWGYDRIAAELNRLGVPSPRRSRKGPQDWRGSAVREIILNDSYAGILVFGERKRVIRGGKKIITKTPERVERIDAPHLRILEPALWARNQARVKANQNGTRMTGNIPTGLLVGNLRCECGSRMYVLGGKHKTYGCGKRHQSGAATCDNATKRPLDNLDAAVVAKLLHILDRPRLIDEVVAAYHSRTTPDAQADERGALEARRDSLRKEFANLTTAITSASNATVITRLVTLLDEKQSALDTAEAALAQAKPVTVAPTLSPENLRSRAEAKVLRLGEVLRGDIPAGREAIRELLMEPAQATPIVVNGAPRYLVRARISAGAVFSGDLTFKTNGDPNGI